MGNKIEAKSDKTPFLTHFKDSFTFMSHTAWSNRFSNRYSLRPCLIESSSGLRQLAGSNETTRNFTLHAPKGIAILLGLLYGLPDCPGWGLLGSGKFSTWVVCPASSSIGATRVVFFTAVPSAFFPASSSSSEASASLSFCSSLLISILPRPSHGSVL